MLNRLGYAEDAGAVAVMVLDKLPYDVRKIGGVARTASVNVDPGDN